MKQSPIFEKGQYKAIEETIMGFLNSQKDFLSGRTVTSPRAVGDALQSLLEESFGKLLAEHIKEYSSNFARRAMADLAFTDKYGFYHVIDTKTHRLDTVFNMPNLTSVERLARYYEDDKNYFDLLVIAYSPKKLHLNVQKVYFVPIEYLDWDCLTIGALGWGQIQIANSNNIIVDPEQTRKKWMLALCDRLMEFYPNEISKIGERIEHFKKVREFWLHKKE